MLFHDADVVAVLEDETLFRVPVRRIAGVGELDLVVPEGEAVDAVEVDEMRGVGRKADHPVGTGRRFHVQAQQFDVCRFVWLD